MSRKAILKDIAHVIRTYQELDLSSDTHYLRVPVHYLRTIMIDNLGKQDRAVFDIVNQADYYITSNDVAHALGITQNHAATILKQLSDINLIDRDTPMETNYQGMLYQSLGLEGSDNERA